MVGRIRPGWPGYDSLSNRLGSRTVQPFRITCETCRSRLKIRSADVIGQIHACPKCGSMVQVVPPAGWDLNTAAMPSEPPSVAGEAALTLSTTASVIIPASAMDDLAAAAAALEAPAVEVPVEIAPSSVLPPADRGFAGACCGRSAEWRPCSCWVVLHGLFGPVAATKLSSLRRRLLRRAIIKSPPSKLRSRNLRRRRLSRRSQRQAMPMRRPRRVK